MTGQPRRPPAASTPRVARDVAEALGTRRIRIALVIYGLAMALVVGQLAYIQLVQGESYADRGVRQRARTLDLPATRGRIYDRDGQVLATSVPSATLFADPRAYRPDTTPDGQPVPPAGDAGEVAAALAPLLERDVDELTALLERDAHFVYLARQVDWELGEQVLELELPGIQRLDEPRRVYPAGGLAGQVVGFTGIDGDGLQGLEVGYDEVLRGQPGTLAVERTPGGLEIASGVRELEPPVVGTDLVLTIDREIQHLAERAAEEAVETHEAAGAGIVVLEVGTGEVLAMASAPGFDPNHRRSGDEDRWRNRVVTDVFEPGSTQKALTVAAAIDAGVVAAHDMRSVADRVTVGGHTFTDAYRRPTMDLSVAQIMERSSNVGTIELAQELGPDRLETALRDFGYGSRLGTGFPGESAGLLMPHEQWWGTSLPTIAIGQGVAVTLLHLAHGYGVLANDGIAVAPRLIRGTVDEDGRLTPSAPPRPRRVVGADTARDVSRMLVAAVSGEHATGTRAAVPGYQVAGKTGTARKPDPVNRGYSDQYVAAFVGYAPAHDPQLVVAVMVDEPSTSIFGGVVAAPVFRTVMEAALVARRLPPDEVPDSLDDALLDARQAALEARQAALDAAQLEGPATDADNPASPPVGSPAGGDGTSVAEDDGPGDDDEQTEGDAGEAAEP